MAKHKRIAEDPSVAANIADQRQHRDDKADASMAAAAPKTSTEFVTVRVALTTLVTGNEDADAGRFETRLAELGQAIDALGKEWLSDSSDTVEVESVDF